MKKMLLLSALGAAILTSCNKDAATIQDGGLNAGLPAKPRASIPVDANGIIQKTFLSKDTIWQADGVGFVKPGSTLTIQAGTYIVAGVTKAYPDQTTGETQNIKGVIVVPKTAKIMAVGTATEPIVFTSDKAAGQRAPGDFGGLVILGQSITNQPTNTRIEGIPVPIEAVDVTYGGSIAADNSGTLKYVRIEFAGFNLSPNNEINGLTLGGVGSGTTLENIQVSWGKDDAFEFFGGTVNAKYLVALSTDDDDFDFDHGYSGTIQYALSLKDPNSTNSTSGGSSDSNGLESDNNAAGTAHATTTRPVLKNFTFIGIQTPATAKSKLKYGNRWRRASSMNITNSIIAGYDIGASFESITTTGSVFSNNVVHAYTNPFNGTVPGTGNATGSGSSTTAASVYLKFEGGNDIFYTTSTASTFEPANLIPLPTSPAYGDGSTTYKGAFNPSSSTLWTDTWTQFAPKTY
ncbi:hypothetical protein M3B46_16905 [Sphingobacterium daejeonense]|uniref:hypothetical protein n=1 Tax=Sphingobacterium daejeonense TaxID=371142 RepID=UPI0021A62FAA|nr:hypothetical protein [Sphingobacterium daejeonense]MCT1532687.1 hypothetical protein [Sphingobacterium daejeonense]